MTWYKKAQHKEPLGHNEELWKSIQEASIGPHAGRSRKIEYSIEDWNKWQEQEKRRKFFIKKFGFSIPSKKAVEKIAEWVKGGKIIEIGAGRGLWARLLSDIGVAVEASDYQSILNNTWLAKEEDDVKDENTFHPIQEMHGKEHAKLGGASDTLMFVWPDFREQDDGADWQSDAIKIFAGNKIIFIGESEGGATGAPLFWEEIRKHWTEKEHISIPNWDGIHDYVALYTKR